MSTQQEQQTPERRVVLTVKTQEGSLLPDFGKPGAVKFVRAASCRFFVSLSAELLAPNEVNAKEGNELFDFTFLVTGEYAANEVVPAPSFLLTDVKCFRNKVYLEHATRFAEARLDSPTTIYTVGDDFFPQEDAANSFVISQYLPKLLQHVLDNDLPLYCINSYYCKGQFELVA